MDGAPAAWEESLSTRQVCLAAGVTYRKLDYWCRLGLLAGLYDEANGSGSQRRFDAAIVPVLRVVGLLIRMSVEHDQIRALAAQVREHGPTGSVEALPGVTVDLAVVASSEPSLRADVERSVAFPLYATDVLGHTA